MNVVFMVLFLLVFGSLNTLTTKWNFDMESVGIDGELKHFTKPWWGNFAMFVAMMAVYPVYAWEQSRKKKDSKQEALLAKEEPKEAGKDWKDFTSVLLPAFLDLTSSGLNFMGLMYISASVWQMLRGSMIIFSALLSIAFLGRRMEKFHWMGIFLCFVGITCVGTASVLGTSGDDSAAPADATTDGKAVELAPADDSGSSMAGVGVVFVMLAQMIQAGQIVAEERLLKDVCIPGTLVVVYEGIWGALIMVVAVFPLLMLLPGSDVGGTQENTLDTLTMIKNSTALTTLLCVYLLSCSTYNIARMLVTANLSAVHFTMIDASRTAFIWVIDLWLTYGAPASLASFGEKWTSMSPLQALGFLILISGQCVYGGLVKLDGIAPWLYDSAEDDEEIEEWQNSLASVISPASRHMPTPLPPFSPPNEELYKGKKGKSSLVQKADQSKMVP